jgi:hypothetical protein
MKTNLALIFTLIFLVFPKNLSAQFHFDSQPPDTIYHPFNKGIQLIEIDYLSFFTEVDFFYSTRSQAPFFYNRPIGNEYIFRDTTGKIVKSFNTYINQDSLNSKFRIVPFVGTTKKQADENEELAFYKRQAQIWPIRDKNKLIFNFRITEYNDTDTSYTNHLKKGLIDLNGKIILPIEYDEIYCYLEWMIVQKNGKWGLMNYAGDILIPIENDSYNNGYNDFTKVIYFLKDTVYSHAYITATKKKVILNNITYAMNEDLGILIVKKDSLYGVFNVFMNKMVVPCVYDIVSFVSFPSEEERVAIHVGMNKKNGVVSIEGKTLIPCIYDRIGLWDQYKTPGFIKVELNGQASELKIGE